MLYSKRKESQFNRWEADKDQVHWVDWESTDEYDMDIDAAAEQMCEKLQECIMRLQSLEAEQLSGAIIAEIVTDVVLPVVVAPAKEMDVSAAGPGATMGPGTPVQLEEMLMVLDAEEREKRQESRKDCSHHFSTRLIW